MAEGVVPTSVVSWFRCWSFHKPSAFVFIVRQRYFMPTRTMYHRPVVRINHL